MERKKLHQKILILSVVASITISSALVVFADNAKVTKSAKTKVYDKLDGHRKDKSLKKDMKKHNMNRDGMQKSNRLADILSKGVTTGVITQTEADKVAAFVKTKEGIKKADMDVKKAKLKAMTDAERKVAMEAKKTERIAEKAKLKTMTVEERAAYIKANRPNRENIFAELVTAGVLTQDKADKVQAMIHQRTEKGMRNGRS